MESDIRAKAPPGPSVAPIPGPFPEIPLRLMTSLLKRSDIRSPPWLLALPATGKPQEGSEGPSAEHAPRMASPRL